MIQTAIIAFLLIGAMFLFTECGSDETEEVTKIEVDKEGIPKYVTAKSHDKSYSDRDSEMAAASYVAKENNESNIHDTNSKTYNLATKEGKDIHSTGTSHETRDDEIALASYGTKGTIETEAVEEEKSTNVEVEIVETVEKVEIVEKVETVEKIEPSNVADVAKVAVATTVVAVVATAINAEEPKEAVSVMATVPSADDIVVPEANMKVVSAEAIVEVDSTVEHAITIPAIPSVPKVKSMEEFASNSQAKKDLNVERNAKDEEIAKNALLAQQLEAKSENEKLLESKNSELGMKIDELLMIAREATKKAEAEHVNNKQEFQSLLLAKQSLETNLSSELENEKKLKATNDELSLKITELLAIAEEGTTKAEAEHNESVVEMQGLLLAKESLESNITTLKATNSELGAKITELLAIAEEGTTKAEAEDNKSAVEMQGLLLAKESLEANVTTLKTTNSELGAKITELLVIAEEGTAKAQAAYDSEQEEMQGLLSSKESLEANLTAKADDDKHLVEENIELQAKIAELLSIAKVATEKATTEHESEKEKMQSLLLETDTLKATNSELATKITELLSIAEEGAEKATAVEDTKNQEFQGLLSSKETLESNLTAKLEKEKLLEEENAKLKEELALIAKAKADKLAAEEAAKAEEEAKAKEEADRLIAEKEAEEKAATEKAEAERLAAEEAAKAEEEAKAKEEADRLAAEKAAAEKEAAEKGEAEAKAAAEKAEAEKLAAEEAKAKEEAERLAAEKEAEEKAAAEKAEAERLAAEEAAKAEEEAKAKEEADRLAAEKAAAEKEAAEKAEAEAKAAAEKAEAEKLAAEEAEKAEAVAAEQKLSDAFSLTKVEFKTGSMQLTGQSKKRLKEAANVMKNYEGYSYKIQGHTDNRGDENFNIALSGKRAKAVKAYLVSQGVSAGILSTEGFGSAQPVASNDTKEGRVQNRRVVFEIIK